MFGDQVMKKKPKSTEFASALDEVNNVDREILVKRSANELMKHSTIKNKTNPLLESCETPDMQSFLKRYWHIIRAWNHDQETKFII